MFTKAQLVAAIWPWMRSAFLSTTPVKSKRRKVLGPTDEYYLQKAEDKRNRRIERNKRIAGEA